MNKKNKVIEAIIFYFVNGYFPCLAFLIITHLILGDKIDIIKLLKASFLMGLIIFLPMVSVFRFVFLKNYIKLFKESRIFGKIFLILGMILVVYGVYQRSQLFK
ncbi:hypothetical protein AAA294_01970 [Fusobacterium varium]|uniref:hypothetical protein n=1 Tax=Fusobacterium varium TaxID=856 RepID=UPI0032C0EF2A